MPKVHRQYQKPRKELALFVPDYYAYCEFCGRRHRADKFYNLCPYCGRSLEIVQDYSPRGPKDKNKR